MRAPHENEKFSSRSVLLVDDDETTRAMVKALLEALGYEVKEAADGSQGLLLLDTGYKPDAVLTDYLMPGMDGAELSMKARELRPGLKVVVMSGLIPEDGRARSLRTAIKTRAVSRFLPKPFGMTELRMALNG